MHLRRALAAAALAVVMPMTAFAGQYPLTMTDLGVPFLDKSVGGAIFDAPLRLVAKLPSASPSVGRFRKDTKQFFTEYDVLSANPITYEQVGDREFNDFFFQSARTSGTLKVSRRLVDKVASNLVGLAKSSAAAGELSSAEEMLAKDPDAAAKAALASLQKQKSKLGDQQRDSLLRMVVALSGTGLALNDAVKAAPALANSGQNLTKVANPDALRSRYGMNFGALAQIPAIVGGTTQSLDSLAQVTKDGPALAKNIAVLTAGLVSLFE
jgi:hypothetical protein